MFGMGTGVSLPLWPPDSTYKWDCEKDRKSCIRGAAYWISPGPDMVKGTDG